MSCRRNSKRTRSLAALPECVSQKKSHVDMGPHTDRLLMKKCSLAAWSAFYAENVSITTLRSWTRVLASLWLMLWYFLHVVVPDIVSEYQERFHC